MRRPHKLRRMVAAGVLAGFVAVGMVAQAGAHLLALTPPATPATAGETLSEFSDSGPYPVGMRTLRDESGIPELTMWYPAKPTEDPSRVSYAYAVRLLGPETETALATFRGQAVQGAPFGGMQPAPLVVLSHGFALTPGSYGWLAEHLASHGMVVVAPDHAETLDPGRLWMSTIERPEQIQAVLADLEVRSEPGGDLHGIVDVSTVAAVGHSYGGYTALAAGGAQLDLDSFRTSCRHARVTDDPITFLCDALEPRIAEIEGPAGTAPSGLDVDAVVSIAGDAAMFGESGLAHLTVPVMVIGGTADTDTPYASGPGLTFRHAGSHRKVEVALDGAGHLVFAGRCEATRRLLALADLGFCSDPSWDRDAAQNVVKHHVATFLRSVLFADPQATAALGEDALAITGVAYDSKGF